MTAHEPDSRATTVDRWGLTRVIAGREISVKLHDRGFLLSTVFFLVVMVLAIAIPAMISGGEDSYTVAAEPEAAPVAQAAADLGAAEQRPPGVPGAQITVEEAGSLEASLDSGADAVLGMDGDTLVVTARTSVPDTLLTLVSTASAGLQVDAVAQEAGLTPAQLQTLTDPAPPRVELLDPPPDYAIPPQLIVLVFGFLFYFAVLTFGLGIAQSVVEEKQSRVVELLVAAVPIRWLLAGKVAGNTLLALAQVALIVGVGLAGAAVLGQSDIVSQALGASGWFLAFFLVGFLMLACLWAVSGSLASRMEDLGSTTLVMQIVVMAPFFAAVFVQDDGPLQRALSYFPLTAPLVMPGRLALGTAAPWEPWVAMAIVVATAALLIVVGARLYQGSVLNTSNRTRLAAAWRAGA